MLPLCSLNENEVGAKHLVMIITNELFCNKYGHDRQGKKENFLMRRRNIYSSAFPVLSYSCFARAVRALFAESLTIKWVVGYADGAYYCNDKKMG